VFITRHFFGNTSDTTYTTDEGETKRLAEDTNYKLEQAIDINAYAIQVNNLPQGRQTVQKAYDVVHGKEVKYSGLDENTTWRVFYVAGENDEFGQEKGTIYLKADQIGGTMLGTYNNELQVNLYNEEKTLVGEVNPKWYAERREANWIENEKAAAYLCDPTVETWNSKIANQTDENIKWIIGAPSAEMFVKSYSQYKNNSYDVEYFSEPYPGYKYKTTGDYEFYIPGAVPIGQKMYRDTSEEWWLASPSSAMSSTVCCVRNHYLACNCDLDCNWRNLPSSLPKVWNSIRTSRLNSKK